MSTKTVFTFGPDDLFTGELQLDESYLVPFTDDQWTTPHNAVDFAPPITGPREVAKINADRTAWLVIGDWSGYVYWLPDRSKHKIKEVGIGPPADALDEDPGPTLDQVKADQVVQINAACEAAITAGFVSEALGTAHTYPCKLTDQANLMASVSAAREPGLAATWRAPFWCQDADSQWSYQPHTTEQICQVGMDGYLATLAKLQRKGQLEQAIQSAQTAADVLSVTW